MVSWTYLGWLIEGPSNACLKEMFKGMEAVSSCSVRGFEKYACACLMQVTNGFHGCMLRVYVPKCFLELQKGLKEVLGNLG